MRHNYLGIVSAGVIVGMVLGATGASMMKNSKGMRGARHSAHRAIHAMENLMSDVKNMIF